MSDFMHFMEELRRRMPYHMEIYYSKITDWCISVTRKGCAADYPNSQHEGEDAVLCRVQGSDMELCFAKAHVAIKKWLIDNTGGY